MKTITTHITLYTFKELSQEAQDRAINDQAEYYTQINWEHEEYIPDFVQEAQEKCEKLRTPWFFIAYVVDYGAPHIIIELEEMGNAFTKDGQLFTHNTLSL